MCHVGEQHHGVGEVARQPVDAEHRGVTPRLRAVGRAQLLELLGDLLRTARAGAFVEHVRGEIGNAGQRRIGRGEAAVHHQFGGDDRHLRPLEVQDGQSVRELEGLRLRQHGRTYRTGFGRRVAPWLVGVDRFGAGRHRRRTCRRIGIELLFATDRERDDARVGAQVCLHRALYVGGRDARIALDVLGQVAGIAKILVVEVELIGASADSLQSLVERALDLVAGTLDFGRGGTVRRKPGDFGIDERLQFGRGVPRARQRLHDKDRCQGIGILPGGHVLCHLQFVHEFLIQAACLAAREDACGDRQLGIARAETSAASATRDRPARARSGRLTVMRCSDCRGGVLTAGAGPSGPRLNEPNCFCTSRLAVAVSKSPQMTSVALFGR